MVCYVYEMKKRQSKRTLRAGRPPLPPDKKLKKLTVWVPLEALEWIESSADSSGVSVGVFVRDLLLEKFSSVRVSHE